MIKKLQFTLLILFFSNILTNANEWTFYQNQPIIYSIKLYNDTLWVCTDKGVCICNTAGILLKYYTKADGMIQNWTSNVTVDKHGIKWFVGFDCISKFDGNYWTNYPNATTFAGKKIYTIAVDDQNKIWCGSDGCIFIFDGSTWTTMTDFNFRNRSIRNILNDRNNDKWIVIDDLLVKYENGVWTTRGNYLDAGTYWSYLATDFNNNIWVSVSSGITKYDGTKLTHYGYSDGCPSLINSIATDSEGNIWVGGWGGSISMFNGSKWNVIRESVGNGLQSITSITFDKNGDKWFSTKTEGLLKFDDPNWTTINLTVTGTNNVYNNDNILVYPNPSKNIINFDFGKLHVCEIKIWDDTGQLIYRSENDFKGYNFTDRPRGIYYLVIVSNENIICKKIVVQ